MKTTTIKIYADHLPWWHLCCRAHNKNSQDTFAKFREDVRDKKKAAFYLSLPMPSDYKKPLEGKRIDKSKVKKEIYKK